MKKSNSTIYLCQTKLTFKCRASKFSDWALNVKSFKELLKK